MLTDEEKLLAEIFLKRVNTEKGLEKHRLHKEIGTYRNCRKLKKTLRKWIGRGLIDKEQRSKRHVVYRINVDKLSDYIKEKRS